MARLENKCREDVYGKRNSLLSDYSVCMIDRWILKIWQLAAEVALLEEGTT